MAMKADSHQRLLARRSDPTPPSHDQRGGWEYPLSRDEKKRRIMYLYQAELEEAERSSTQDREALRALQKHAAAANTVSACSATAPENGSDCPGSSRPRLDLHVMGFLVLLAAIVAVSWAFHLQVSSVGANSREGTCSSGVAGSGPNVTVNASETVAANVSDRVLGMRSEGHMRLKLSNCMEAEWWFSMALSLLAQDVNVSDIDAWRNHIRGERGFALVCSQRFKDGAHALQQHLDGIGLEHGMPHLLNAWGYAAFHTQDFAKAAKLFEIALHQDRQNPVLWSNLAAAKMVSGEFEAADEALTRADSTIEKVNAHQDHHMTLILKNAHFLHALANNQTVPSLPLVELWNGYLD